MRSHLEAVLENHNIYTPRRQEYDTGEKIPFRVSPVPLSLSPDQRHEIEAIGADVTSYFLSVDRLYRTDERVHDLLDTGKPPIFLDHNIATRYLFVRPDLIIGEDGFSVCEIETSPFGLALAELLNRGYRQAGHETMVEDNTLSDYVQAHTTSDGTISYSNRTSAYTGQMSFLAARVFSNSQRHWQSRPAADIEASESGMIYRGFYLDESVSDPAIEHLLDDAHVHDETFLPSATPHMEEKADLAFLWDKRFQSYFETELGHTAFRHLLRVVPPTWIVGQEQFFAPGLPHGVTDSIGLASLPNSRRDFVLKSSGFTGQSSWAEGVYLLHQRSSTFALEALQRASADRSSLHVVQQFVAARKIPLEYQTDAKNTSQMTAKVRLTPYFSVDSTREVKLLAIKATGCENTDLLHASSSSINMAVN